MVVSYLGDRHSGSFPLAVRQMKYLMVVIEYFTKWIEVEPVAQITTHKVQHFVWKNIVCRFEVPKWLVSDNGTQFISQQLGKLCTELGIKQVFASVEHPQTNWQVESANKVLLKGLKRRLEKAKGTWAEEAPRVVWAYHTTPQSTTKETPFSLVYGSDAMIPQSTTRRAHHVFKTSWPKNPTKKERWTWIYWIKSGRKQESRLKPWRERWSTGTAPSWDLNSSRSPTWWCKMPTIPVRKQVVFQVEWFLPRDRGP